MDSGNSDVMFARLVRQKEEVSILIKKLFVDHPGDKYFLTEVHDEVQKAVNYPVSYCWIYETLNELVEIGFVMYEKYGEFYNRWTKKVD